MKLAKKKKFTILDFEYNLISHIRKTTLINAEVYFKSDLNY